MDVRGSLNAEDNQEYITGEGSHSMVENDSFYAKAPPLAASTVGRSKSRSVDMYAFIVPHLFEEKRTDIIFGFPSFRPSVLLSPYRSMYLVHATPTVLF